MAAIKHRTKIRNLTVLQWNCNHLANRTAELHNLIHETSPDIIALSELCLKPSSSIFCPGYAIYRKDRISTSKIAAGGVALCIKRTITHEQIHIDTNNIETTAINLHTRTHSLRIISAYISPTQKLLNTDLQAIFPTNTPTIVFGDLNSKHTLFGCRKTNLKGKQLHKYTVKNDITVNSPLQPTHVHTDGTHDTLDI
jgi:hypothetical protein